VAPVAFNSASFQRAVPGGGWDCAAPSLGSSSGKRRAAWDRKKGDSSRVQIQLQEADFLFKALRQTNIQALVSYQGTRSDRHISQCGSQAAEFLPVVVQFPYKISAFWSQSTDKNPAIHSVINLSKEFFLGRRC